MIDFPSSPTEGQEELIAGTYWTYTSGRWTLSSLLANAVTNGDTGHAPTGEAVFEQLALKANLAGPQTHTGAHTFSGQILLFDGSALTPSFSFAGDTGNNTGFYLSAQNELSFGANGSQRVKLGTFGIDVVSGAYRHGGTQVVGARVTGWTGPTGTATRTTFDTATVTTAQLAERVKALIDDLTTHGLIGT